MKTALFIILPYVSHYNACLGLARAFQRRGFRVVFTGSPHLEEYLVAQDYEFRSIVYTSEYNVRTLKGFIGFFLRRLVDRREVARRYREWYKSVIDARSVYEEYRPEYTFIDAHLSHYYLFLYKYRDPSVTILSVEQSMRKSRGVPPLNSFYVPSRSRRSVLKCEMLWYLYVAKTYLGRLKNKIAFLNRGEAYFQKRLSKKYQLRWKDVFDIRNTSFVGLKAAPTVILGSEAMEFAHRRKSDNEYYLCLPIRRDETARFTDEYVAIRKEIHCLKNKSCQSVIYCSFGTLDGINAIQGTNFIQKLIAAVRGREELILIVSTGSLSIEATKSKNIFLLERPPQLDVLSYSNIMVTHGGHNSINECLQAGVPMLVYPLNRRTDQPGNATRVYANGYGLFGRMEQDTPEIILSKINAVLRMGKRKKPPDDTPRFEQYFSV